ncbi:MAG TPA: hypothetical protein VIJ86_10325 [Acidimicrobiales bacterium]
MASQKYPGDTELVSELAALTNGQVMEFLKPPLVRAIRQLLKRGVHFIGLVTNKQNGERVSRFGFLSGRCHPVSCGYFNITAF